MKTKTKTKTFFLEKIAIIFPEVHLQKKERAGFEPTTSSELVYDASTNPQDHDALTQN